MEFEALGSEVEFTVHNIGGINQTEVSFEPGVTVLAGQNATNRTSLLQGIMAALGSDDVSVKADADEAHVELQFEGETYTRSFERQNGAVDTGGSPYLENSTLADLFAFLLESNDARRAVVTDANLRDIIMQPVDTDDIQDRIDQLLNERRQVSRKLDELEDLKDELPGLEEQRTQLQQEIEATEAELADIEAEIEAKDTDLEESKEEQEEVEAKLAELRETRSQLEDVRYELETEQQSLDSLRDEKHDVDQAIEELPTTSDDRLNKLANQIDELRTRKQSLETELNDIQSVMSFNQERLEDGTETFTQMFNDGDDESVTDDLLPDQTVTCWTCGSRVEKSQIETTIEKLQEVSQELVSQITEVEDELTEITNKRDELTANQDRRSELEHRRQTLADKIEESERRIEELSEHRDTLRDEVDTIEAEVEALENDAYEEILAFHKEANQLEHDLGQLENERERIEGNIESIERRLAEEENLRAQREAFTDEIGEMRTRIERIETEAIEQFNTHMDEVLNLLEYENIARIWLERRETEVRKGRQKVTKSVFDLHVVRQTESGTTYQDTIDNLSESEREVTGLIFALSGYLAHNVHETVPFMLLDSVEALDTARMAALVEYMADFSNYLVVALLPEYDATLSDEYPRITDI